MHNTHDCRFVRLLPLLLLPLAAGLIGCHGMAPGRMEWVQTDSDAPRAGNVYLLRGWIGVFSTGVDDLAEKLNDRGVRAHVYQEGQTGSLARAIAETYRGATNPEPLVLIGHSYGADNVVRAARILANDGVTVDLMVTLDATTPPRVPGNVKLTYNYFQPQATDFIPLFRGIPLKQDEGATGRLVNVNLRDDGKDLLTPGTNHINIDKNDNVHEAVIRNVLEVCPERPVWLARHRGASNAPAPAGGGR